MNITKADLGWVIAVWLIAGWVLSGISNWFSDRYEFTRTGRRRFRVTRRWCGTRAHVCLRSAGDDDGAERFLVLERDYEDTSPWLRVQNIDVEDAEPFWAPVADFAPYTVRRLRPHVERYGRLPVLWLTRYLPLREPAGWPQDGA